MTWVEEHVVATSQKIARKPSVETKKELASRYYQDEIVIVNCTYAPLCDVYIRIWESTVLRDQDTRCGSTLLDVRNIPYAPEWMEVPARHMAKFTLVFSALPRTCKVFDLLEEIPDSEPFEILYIPRNSEDVYDVVIDNDPF